MFKILAFAAVVAFGIGGNAATPTEAGQESTHTPIFVSVNGSGGLH